MRDIGKNIRQLRIKRSMTQDDLAERLFVTRQTVSNYETGKSRPDIDMLERISQVLEADLQEVLYGPAPKRPTGELLRLAAGGILAAGLGILWMALKPLAKKLSYYSFNISIWLLLEMIVGPLCLLAMGWTAAQLLGMALGKKPLAGNRVGYVRRGVLLLIVVILALNVWFVAANAVNDWQYHNHLRGSWTESVSVSDNGETSTVMGWTKLPAQMPGFVEWAAGIFLRLAWRTPVLRGSLGILCGVGLWLLGFPAKRKTA